jgi:hypothetical protein
MEQALINKRLGFAFCGTSQIKTLELNNGKTFSGVILLGRHSVDATTEIFEAIVEEDGEEFKFTNTEVKTIEITF